MGYFGKYFRPYDLVKRAASHLHLFVEVVSRGHLGNGSVGCKESLLSLDSLCERKFSTVWKRSDMNVRGLGAPDWAGE